MADEPPALVTLHLWRVPSRHVPAAITRMVFDRRPVRAFPGVRFAKLLGTGAGRSFTPRDADPRGWGLLVAWTSYDAAQAFESSSTVRAWSHLADHTLRVGMRPLATHGRWAGREPFGRPVPARWHGPVGAVTRARIATRKAATFWGAVPPVSAAVREAPGLRLAVGIGEAPIGLQGTFSLWESAEALTDFAYRQPAHREAIRRTRTEGWYAEELFARFAVEEIAGSLPRRVP